MVYGMTNKGLIVGNIPIYTCHTKSEYQVGDVELCFRIV